MKPAEYSLLRSHFKAFTLIELLVVISIISLLVALLLPVLSAARGRATDIKCTANMRGSNFAFQTYFNDFKGFIPPLIGTSTSTPPPAYSYSNWYGLIAPYAGIDSPSTVANDKPRGMVCPVGAGGTGFSFYLYSMLYSTRFKPGLGDPEKFFVSNRVDDFARPSETGLQIENGKYASAIYYMVANWSLFGNPTYAGRATHDGRGLNLSFMDGHVTFYGVSRENTASIAKGGTADKPYGDHGPTMPFVHRAFWGQYHDGTYAPFSTNYRQYTP